MRALTRLFGGRKARTARHDRSARKRSPSLERLEDRTVPAILASELIPAVSPPVIVPATQPVATPAPEVSGGAGSTAPETSVPNVPPGGGETRIPPVQPGGGEIFITGGPDSSGAHLNISITLGAQVCHHTSSNTNPYVLLGIRNASNPSVNTHLRHGDIVITQDSSGNPVIMIRSQLILGPSAPADQVTAITGDQAVQLLQGLDFSRQGTPGQDACDELARRLGDMFNVDLLHVSPSGDARAGFVQELYQEALGRGANDSEVTAWLSVLDAAGRQAVVNGISNSPEAFEHLVQNWYQLFLGRSAQGGEEQGFVIQLEQGAEMETIITEIVSSGEFFARAGKGSAEGFVTALYSDFLHRACSPAECAGWVQALAQSGRQEVVEAIQHSTEFRTAVVEDFYQTLLGRAGSSAEIAGWVYSQLELCEILPALRASEEFFLYTTS